jgi:hypothetical protein
MLRLRAVDAVLLPTTTRGLSPASKAAISGQVHCKEGSHRYNEVVSIKEYQHH